MTYRPLFCPICGAKVESPVQGEKWPEVHVIPDHAPASGVNLCQGVGVTVTLDLVNCRECGRRMEKHPTGVCQSCYTGFGRRLEELKG